MSMSLELLSLHKERQRQSQSPIGDLRARYERIGREWLPWVAKEWERGRCLFNADGDDIGKVAQGVATGAEEGREVLLEVEEVRCEEGEEAVGGGQKTEVYENFELEILRPEVKRKPYTPIEFSQPGDLNTSPPFSFLTELKSTLT